MRESSKQTGAKALLVGRASNEEEEGRSVVTGQFSETRIARSHSKPWNAAAAAWTERNRQHATEVQGQEQQQQVTN
ncbi:hypothetical protein HUJ05_004563 [Dendroctonus ponderosae]|nr:hypothetical protein HUJ05_004563 [Dendroctonus ponderosae]